jgi:HEAT repeat protein
LKDKKFLPLIIAVLDDPSPDVRATTLAVLERQKSGAKDAIPKLLKMLKEGEDAVEQNLLPEALLIIGPKDERAIAAVIERARDKKHKAREFGIWALRRLGPNSERAVSVLKRIASDQTEDPKIRESAEEALKVMKEFRD